MTTHIFLAMGMWDDVVSQNIIASGPDHAHWTAGHYTIWLGYGYLQQGRNDAARAHLEHLRHNAGPTGGRGPLVHMRAAYLVNSERWSDSVAQWPLAPLASPMLRAVDAFTLGYAALKRGDLARAGEAASAIAKEVSANAGETTGDPVIRILNLEMRAAIASARGRADSAVKLAREATRLEDALPLEFGPPIIPKPTHELAGEILLAGGKAAEAQREFTRALELTPGRARSLIGLARAASTAGDEPVARAAAQDLLRNWRSADASLAERAEMERLVKPR
jgi:tetratricopeptide (TPR) repeat protein